MEIGLFKKWDKTSKKRGRNTNKIRGKYINTKDVKDVERNREYYYGLKCMYNLSNKRRKEKSLKKRHIWGVERDSAM